MQMVMDFSFNRILKIFILSLVTAVVPFCILSYMWGGYHNVSIRVMVAIFIINTLPCIIINILYHRYDSIKEWFSSFYFFITFFLSFAAIMVRGVKLLYGNYFDYLAGYITLFMLAEAMSVFVYVTYIFVKYIKKKYDLPLYEKIIYLITGIIFTNFIIVFSAFTSGFIIYIFD